jgi:hypothetical protein
LPGPDDNTILPDSVAEPESNAKDGAKEAKAGAEKHAKVLSHRINETFGTDELFEELADKKTRGKRGEIVLIAQLVVTALVVFPPLQLEGIVYLSGTLPQCLACCPAAAIVMVHS